MTDRSFARIMDDTGPRRYTHARAIAIDDDTHAALARLELADDDDGRALFAFLRALPLAALALVCARPPADLSRTTVRALAVRRARALPAVARLRARATATTTSEANGSELALAIALDDERDREPVVTGAVTIATRLSRARATSAIAAPADGARDARAVVLGVDEVCTRADLIGDDNPLARDDEVARSVGLPAAVVPYSLVCAMVVARGARLPVAIDLARPALVDERLVHVVAGTERFLLGHDGAVVARARAVA